ncbi:MAG: glycosyltransferase family 4 protein [Tissierellia bacterium]|nr:glycosyltransferase family 4 protein [Tissierellia bacterium]
MKILHYVNEGNLAWVQPWMQLLDALRRKGVNNIIICPEEGTLSSIARDYNFETRTCTSTIPWAPALCIKVGEAIKEISPDLIHTRLSSAAAIGGYWGKKLNIPVVATLDKYPKTKYYVNVAHLVGCSRAVSKHMVDQGISEEKVSTIHNPILYERYVRDLNVRADFRKKAGLKEDQIVVLGAGRFVDWKAFDVLIKAAAKIESNRDWVLWLVGDGPERKHLEELVDKYALKKRTSFWGFASDIRPYLWASDVFVQPSNKPEGFSLMLLEAMASGLPAIATDIGGTLDILEDDVNGWLIKPNDIEGLSRIISSALNNKSLKAMAYNATEKASLFQVEPLAEQYMHLYESLAFKRKDF